MDAGSGVIHDIPSLTKTALSGINSVAESAPVKDVMNFGSLEKVPEGGVADDTFGGIVKSLGDVFDGALPHF